VDGGTIVALVAVVVTVLIALVGAVSVVAFRSGATLQKVDSIEQWMHERDAQTEARLFRLEQAVDLTPAPRDPPAIPIVRVTKPRSG
jgi:hypothetical protein